MGEYNGGGDKGQIGGRNGEERSGKEETLHKKEEREVETGIDVEEEDGFSG